MALKPRLRTVAVLAAGIGAFGLVAPTAASATTVGSSCSGNNDCVILYYNSNMGGSSEAYSSGSTGFAPSVSNLAGYTFQTTGAGQYQYVKNNAASVNNLSDSQLVIWYNSGYSGACDTIDYDNDGNLHNTYNEDASFADAGNRDISSCYGL